MASATGARPARGLARRAFWGVARGVAVLWVVPALYWNIDWTPGASLGGNVVSAVMILGSAAILEGIRHCRSFPLIGMGLVALLFLLYSNANTAFKSLAFVGEAASEAKQGKIDGGSHLASQVSQAETRRAAQVQLAGESAVGTLEAEARTLQLSDLRAWNATSQCEDVTAKASGTFCSRVAQAKAKVEAARKRDEIDAELKALRAERKDLGVVPVVADAYAENIASILSVVLGRKLGADDKRVITAHYEVVRAIGLELLAAVGPAFHLLLIDVMQMGAGLAAAGVARARAMGKNRRKEPTSAESKAQATQERAASADSIDRAIADEFEDAPAGKMTAKEIRPLIHAWFEKQGLPLPVESELWAKMRQRFKHDPNNNRPRYLGLKPKTKMGPRIVVDNG